MTLTIHLLVVIGEDDPLFVDCATKLNDYLLVRLPAFTSSLKLNIPTAISEASRSLARRSEI